MKIGLPEVRTNSFAFATRWKGVAEERAEAQSFWNELFAVYGMSRQAVASFEEPIKNLKGGTDRIDVFWKGVMMGEHKSAGRDLSKAASQAMNYIQSLLREGRGQEIPKFLVVSDFARIIVYDLRENKSDLPIADFKTEELPKHFKSLLFLGGEELVRVDGPEEAVDLEAVELLGVLHDELERGGFSGTGLERLLVRILFCLFAEDTGIFDDRVFSEMIRTARPDGSDLGPLLSRFFKVLDQPRELRSKALPKQLADLPYVNGALFRDDFGFAEFDAKMLVALQHCATLDWSRISPAVFGSLFQSVMLSTDGKKIRRQIGAHYTSERDILRVIGPLFLDELKEELERAGTSKRILNALHDRIAEIRIFDPACGCGNFLVVAYRELRLLEYEILRRLYGEKVEPEHLKVRIEQVNGIEINEWPARIAEVAMFLIEHQMDDRMRELLPKFFTRLPIKSVANIHVGNALRMDWNDVLPANRCAYIVGNPPFVGKKERNSEQREDMKTVWGTSSKSGNLDYVTCWFKQASVYSKGTSVQTAFVATNSIAQGEQASSFLGALIDEGWNIKFAHRTFAWQSEARGAAHVKVIIVGFTWQRLTGALLFDYSQDATSGTRSAVSRLNQYLTEGGDAPSITARGRPLCAVPHMTYGSQAIDQERNAPEGTGLIVTSGQRLDLLRETPELEPFIKQYVGGKELLSGESRYCCWLEGAPPSLIRRSALLQIRLESVRKFRLASARAQTRRLATTPTLFGGNLQPTTDYLLIPKVTSETRDYIPMRFFGSDVIASGSALVVADANHFHFGVLTSAMHMGWMRRVAGRMKSDYQYSANVVYNNFPWPQEVDPKAKSAVEAAAQTVLDARAAHPNATLADLYDPLTMPPNLRAAHNDLDKAVDRCYRKQPFTSERERVEHLFELYQRLAAPLKAEAEPAKKKRTGRARSATSDTEAAK